MRRRPPPQVAEPAAGVLRRLHPHVVHVLPVLGHPLRGAAVELFVQLPDESGRIRRTATPLFLVLIIVETTDVTFATDSIPAIFAVTRDPFIIYTSNVCAVLGLRALYFLLANVMDKFAYLKLGLSLVLIFIGAKMLLEDFFHIPIVASLGVVAAILVSSILASLRWPREKGTNSP